ncbi:transcription elongation factor [Colletotrichum tofieldiae]|uniref:Transcription elongation factor 1 homolog n=1 Tax=Colletotrichum tofieldiae TaxID=708197 RepID=A0A166NWL0_9PEZI|nr:transcription elongation factor [Colletotrichum tofieldiae]GKT85158.1 transcription elongation factor [Colletotrichum tofieldiae]
MGKRKSSSKPQGPKKKDPLPSKFTCLFCNHEDSVAVKLDKKAGVGSLDCRVCGQMFQCSINYLSAAVDVYGEWVDAADAVAKEAGPAAGSQNKTSSARRAPPSRPVNDDDDDDDRRYGGEGIDVDDDEY